MDTYINITQPMMVGKMNSLEKYIEEKDPEFVREERRRGCKEGCCLLICIIIIIILYFVLDYYFSTR